MPKKIILTADDYGAMDFIDDAIIEAIKLRKINCVSAFVCFPDSHHRIERLLNLQEDMAEAGNPFAIGLHFSITAGAPLTNKETALSEKVKGKIQFKSPVNYPFKTVGNAVSEFNEELKLQIDTLGEWIGKDNIDHVSNHHGVTYVDVDLFKMYVDVIKKYELPIRSPNLWSHEKLSYINYYSWYTPPVNRKLNPLTKYGIFELHWAWEFFEAVQFKTKTMYALKNNMVFPYVNNDCIYGLPFQNNLEIMFDVYRQADMTTEFMFHLGHFIDDPEEKDLDDLEAPNGIDAGYFGKRKYEFALLKEMDLDAIFNLLQIEKITFSGLYKKDTKMKYI